MKLRSKLKPRQLRIKRVLPDKLRMRALRHDAPTIHHDNPVRALHRREPMRDHERRARTHQPFERLLESALTNAHSYRATRWVFTG